MYKDVISARDRVSVLICQVGRENRRHVLFNLLLICLELKIRGDNAHLNGQL